MADPPDRDKAVEQLSYQTNQNKLLTSNSKTPKYLIINRIESAESLSKVSPFLIKKVIDSVCGGEVEMCKKLRNGSILIKTKTFVQACKLIKLSALSPYIKVEVCEHNTLNQSKGVIFSRELIGISEETIRNELKNQGVSEVRKIKKKVDSILVETGLLILTFDNSILPNHILIGYEKIKIRPYIPLPLRCMNCLKYGHSAKICNNTKICANCAKTSHIDRETNDKCTDPSACVSCTNNGSENADHNALDKKCPVFIKEKEIQAIITLEKVDRRRAIATYEERHPLNTATYASKLAKTNPPITYNKSADSPHSPTLSRMIAETTSVNSIIPNSSNSSKSTLPLNSSNPPYTSQPTQPACIKPREQTDYSDILNSNFLTKSTLQQITKDNKTKIYPKNISNRTKAMLKKINKLKGNSKQDCDSTLPIADIDSDSSESMSTDQ